MSSVKGCPFCTGHVDKYIGTGHIIFFKCRSCKAIVSFDRRPTLTGREAIAAFNQRDGVEEIEISGAIANVIIADELRIGGKRKDE